MRTSNHNLDYTITLSPNLVFPPPMAQERIPSPPFSASVATAGFGEYQNFAPADFNAHQTTQKTNALITSILLGVAAAGVVAATVFIPPSFG